MLVTAFEWDSARTRRNQIATGTSRAGAAKPLATRCAALSHLAGKASINCKFFSGIVCNCCVEVLEHTMVMMSGAAAPSWDVVGYYVPSALCLHMWKFSSCWGAIQRAMHHASPALSALACHAVEAWRTCALLRSSSNV